jgi:hypothetical protein
LLAYNNGDFWFDLITELILGGGSASTHFLPFQMREVAKHINYRCISMKSKKLASFYFIYVFVFVVLGFALAWQALY